MDFSQVKGITIPEGNVKQIDIGGVTVWKNLEIVPWATGTDAQILAMVQAADNGDIDLHEYWSVGDTRTVTLEAMSAYRPLSDTHVSQDIELVLMDTTCTGFTFTSNEETPNFIVGQKDALIEAGAMNTSVTNGWANSPRRGWCNDVYRMAIPSSIRSIFKQFNWQCVQRGDIGTLSTVSDYFALAPERAVISSGERSRTEEWALFAQWAYYAQESSHKFKKYGINGPAADWWLCSPENNNGSNLFFWNDGNKSWRGNPPALIGLAPFGCI